MDEQKYSRIIEMVEEFWLDKVESHIDRFSHLSSIQLYEAINKSHNELANHIIKSDRTVTSDDFIDATSMCIELYKRIE